MLARNDNQQLFLYRQVIDLVRQMQQQGTLRAGDKLPSLRNMASRLQVSVPTIKQAYQELERQGFIQAREKSGYFLRASSQSQNKLKKPRLNSKPTQVSRQQLIEQVYQGIHQPGNLALGISNPTAALSTQKAITRALRRASNNDTLSPFSYGPSYGCLPLRQHIAQHYFSQGLQANPEDIIVTNGAQEAISLALRAIAKPGDVIAVESPCYFGILETIESLGMLALELPLCAEDGLLPDDVRKAISRHKVKAVMISTSISNPLGSWLTEERKRAMVSLLEDAGIPLIEDDAYGDLYFGPVRGKAAQYYSQKGLVISCSSFSKTAAPSLRIGWLLAPGFTASLQRLKRAYSQSSSMLSQATLIEYLRGGEYERYLRQLRQVLQTNKERMISLLQRELGEQVRISDPKGGCVLWLEFPKAMDTNLLFQQLLAEQISVTPGVLFSATDRYRHCLRLSFGLTWDAGIETGLQTFSTLARNTLDSLSC